MFGIGPLELILVFAIMLLFFGGKRLPSIATGLGKAIKNFKFALKDPVQEENSNPPLAKETNSKPVEKSTD